MKFKTLADNPGLFVDVRELVSELAELKLFLTVGELAAKPGRVFVGKTAGFEDAPLIRLQAEARAIKEKWERLDDAGG